MEEELKRLVDSNEKILYEGRPSKKCFIFESIINPLLPVAIIWGIIDFGVLGGTLVFGESGMLFFLIPFMLLHLMPVWIYLAGAILSFRK